MKRYTIQTLVPALALLAVGCSTPNGMQSTEYDDMYYSSSDKTEYIQPEATAQAEEAYETEEAVTNKGVVNPEYADERALNRDYEGDEYYDGRSYDPRDNWYRPNYSFVDPYWASAYTPVYASRYHDPFYDPFYRDPFYYNSYYNSYYSPYYSPYRNPYLRSGVSVSIAFGSVWASPYWGNHYGRYYNNWYPYNSYYNGFYHGYSYGRTQYIYDRPGYVQNRKVQYGPRGERSRIVTEGRTDGSGRPDRGTLSSDNEQQVVTPVNGRRERPSRTDRSRTTETRKEVITTQPDVNRQARPQRQRGNTPEAGETNVVPRERIQPVERTQPARSRGEYTPQRETRQPVRQQTRPTEVRRETSNPVRQAPVRSSYERSETRSTPIRSSGSSGSSSGSSSESRSGGRPTRGGN